MKEKSKAYLRITRFRFVVCLSFFKTNISGFISECFEKLGKNKKLLMRKSYNGSNSKCLISFKVNDFLIYLNFSPVCSPEAISLERFLYPRTTSRSLSCVSLNKLTLIIGLCNSFNMKKTNF